MKKLIIFCFACLAISGMHAQVAVNKIAVMEFQAGVGLSQSDVDGISAIFLTYFRPDGYEIVERSQLDRVINEQKFQKTSITEREMVRIGEILNLSKIVIGNVNLVMGEYNVDVRVVNVETGTVMATEGTSFANSSYRESMQALAVRLTEQISVKKKIAQVANLPKEDFIENTLGLNMKMIYVDGGEFDMGATNEQGMETFNNERPVHHVQPDSYYIGECEITQEQWEKVMGTSIKEQAQKAGQTILRGIGSDYPMYYVSWEDAWLFCQELSSLTGKKYCLPTEAQWEYAARGGKNPEGSKYSGGHMADIVMNYSKNSGLGVAPVKSKRANNIVLYDMSGNIWEWCSDLYGAYSSAAKTNPTGSSTGVCRVLRGGCWYSDANVCRVSSRIWNFPTRSNCYYGFRVVVIP